MKKRAAPLLLAAALLLGAFLRLGVGPYVSGSAVSDLQTQLTELHGEPYSRKTPENATESMEFSIKPASFFLTDYNLRDSLGWDYRYRCEVIFRVTQGDTLVREEAIAYTGIDPMGHENATVRAYLDLE